MKKASEYIKGAANYRSNKHIPIIKLAACELTRRLARAIAYSLSREVQNRDSLIWVAYKSTIHRKDLEYVALIANGLELKSVEQIVAIDFSEICSDEFKASNVQFIYEVIEETKLLYL